MNCLNCRPVASTSSMAAFGMVPSTDRIEHEAARLRGEVDERQPQAEIIEAQQREELFGHGLTGIGMRAIDERLGFVGQLDQRGNVTQHVRAAEIRRQRTQWVIP